MQPAGEMWQRAKAGNTTAPCLKTRARTQHRCGKRLGRTIKKKKASQIFALFIIRRLCQTESDLALFDIEEKQPHLIPFGGSRAGIICLRRLSLASLDLIDVC